MRWLRLYDDVINDPKVLRLPEATRWHWVAVLCVASKHDGALPPLDELAFYLRTTAAKATVILTALVKAGLLDKTETGFAPHNWSGRQYKSDGSAERVKRHREKRAAAGLQSQWTPPKALRQAVYDRDGHRCVYCGSTERLSLDHRTPEIRGGDHHIDNLATACLSCNGAKRDMTETEYRESVTLLKRPQTTEAEYRTEKPSLREGSAPAKRGTRLPSDWTPDESETRFATEHGLSFDRMRTEAIKFRNYWTSKSGKDATKLDWSRTWQNWILNAKGPSNGQRTANPRTTGHDALLAVATRKAREIIGDGEVARAAGEAEFSFGDGAFGGAARGHHGSAGAASSGYDGGEPVGGTVLEGEVIAPDKASAGLSDGWRRH